MKCFAVRDLKAEGFGVPFFQPTFGLAERAFNDACLDEKTYMYKSPEDFSLWCIGEFEQKTGTFVPEQVPKKICDAKTQKQ